MFKIGDVVKPVADVLTKNLREEALDWGLLPNVIEYLINGEEFKFKLQSTGVVVAIKDALIAVAMYDRYGELQEVLAKEEELELVK